MTPNIFEMTFEKEIEHLILRAKNEIESNLESLREILLFNPKYRAQGINISCQDITIDGMTTMFLTLDKKILTTKQQHSLSALPSRKLCKLADFIKKETKYYKEKHDLNSSKI